MCNHFSKKKVTKEEAEKVAGGCKHGRTQAGAEGDSSLPDGLIFLKKSQFFIKNWYFWVKNFRLSEICFPFYHPLKSVLGTPWLQRQSLYG